MRRGGGAAGGKEAGVSRKALVWMGVCVALIAGAAAARATVREWRMTGLGIDPAQVGSLPSVRLDGMAGAGLAVPDETNELNAHDFGGNVAGVLADADGWVIDTWTGNFLQDHEQSLFRSQRRFGHVGFRAVQRTETRALGVDVNWAFFESDDRYGDWNKVRGPLITALLNQRIGRFTLGGSLGLEQEKEDLISDDVFAIRHRQDRWVGQLGVQTELAGFDWSAAWDFEQGDVLGASVDPDRFHEDAYTWQRPVNRYRFALVMPRRGALEGGVRGAWMDREGFERARVSWSDDFPQNPSHTLYETEAITFSESESRSEIGTLWRWHLDPRTVLGLGALYLVGDQEVIEAVNFKGSQREGRAASDAFGAAAGLSRRFFSGRLLATIEGALSLESWEFEEGNAGLQEGTARAFSGLAGLEYFVGPGVLLRAGGRWTSADLDVDQPFTLATGRAVTGGFSWLPSGGLVQIHGAVRFERSEPDDPAVDTLPERTTVSYSLAARLLP